MQMQKLKLHRSQIQPKSVYTKKTRLPNLRPISCKASCDDLNFKSFKERPEVQKAEELIKDITDIHQQLVSKVQEFSSNRTSYENRRSKEVSSLQREVDNLVKQEIAYFTELIEDVQTQSQFQSKSQQQQQQRERVVVDADLVDNDFWTPRPNSLLHQDDTDVDIIFDDK